MNARKRKKLKRKANLKLLFYTFIGAFILFFAGFTYFLPILTPKVEIPALSEDYILDSVTSQDFRGRIDPRLHSIELQETTKPEQNKTNDNEVALQSKNEPTNKIPSEDNWFEEKSSKPVEQKTQEESPKVTVNIPPRPKSVELRDKVDVTAPVPVYQAKVVVGDFTNPKEVEIASDILSSLDFKPFVRELNGKYILQVASFSDKNKAEDLVNELKGRNFDAKVIYE